MEVQEKDIKDFQETVKDNSIYDFCDYSISSLRRRLTKILLELELDMSGLTLRMKKDPDFLEHTVRKVTVHTTELFRDPSIWTNLHQKLLPSWSNRDSINIWHPGCSSGQEVYSMMMILDDLDLLERSTIYASDLNPDILDIARKGRYKYHFNQSYLENFEKVLMNGEVHHQSKKQWKKYFSVDESRDLIQMNQQLCSKPVYKKIDLVQHSNPFLVNFDLIVCRNVIIYFNQNLQNRVFDLFHNSLKYNGVLLLGVHESILGAWSEKFRKADPYYHKLSK